MNSNKIYVKLIAILIFVATIIVASLLIYNFKTLKLYFGYYGYSISLGGAILFGLFCSAVLFGLADLLDISEQKNEKLDTMIKMMKNQAANPEFNVGDRVYIKSQKFSNGLQKDIFPGTTGTVSKVDGHVVLVKLTIDNCVTEEVYSDADLTHIKG